MSSCVGSVTPVSETPQSPQNRCFGCTSTPHRWQNMVRMVSGLGHRFPSPFAGRTDLSRLVHMIGRFARRRPVSSTSATCARRSWRGWRRRSSRWRVHRPHGGPRPCDIVGRARTAPARRPGRDRARLGRRRGAPERPVRPLSRRDRDARSGSGSSTRASAHGARSVARSRPRPAHRTACFRRWISGTCRDLDERRTDGPRGRGSAGGVAPAHRAPADRVRRPGRRRYRAERSTTSCCSVATACPPTTWR